MSTTEVLRSLIAMNNLGATLLEKHCYQQAFDILKEAIWIFEGLHADHDGAEASQNAWRKYREAEKMYANPIAAAKLAIKIRVIPQNFKGACMGEILASGPASLVLFPTRIEDTEVLKDINDKSMSTRLTSLLYNFGIAHLCLSLTTGILDERAPITNRTPDEILLAIQQYVTSINIFRMTLAAYTGQLTNTGKSDIEYCERLHDIILVLNNLVIAYEYTRQTEGANVHRSMLNRVVERIHEYAVWNIVVAGCAEESAAQA